MVQNQNPTRVLCQTIGLFHGHVLVFNGATRHRGPQQRFPLFHSLHAHTVLSFLSCRDLGSHIITS